MITSHFDWMKSKDRWMIALLLLKDDQNKEIKELAKRYYYALEQKTENINWVNIENLPFPTHKQIAKIIKLLFFFR